MLAGQFAEIWRRLDCPNDFVIVEQGAHHGSLRPTCWRRCATAVRSFLRHCVTESWSRFRFYDSASKECCVNLPGRRNGARRSKRWSHFPACIFPTSWSMPMPVHLIVAAGAPERRNGTSAWSSEHRAASRLCISRSPIRDCKLKSRKFRHRRKALMRRRSIWPPSIGSMRWRQSWCEEWCLSSITGFPGTTSMLPVAGPARCNAILVTACCLRRWRTWGWRHHRARRMDESRRACRKARSASRGFTDQHHFLTGLLSSYPGLASAAAEKSRALQMLLHPEFLGTKFQFLALTKGFPAAESLGGSQVRAGQPAGSGPGVRWNTKVLHISALAEVIAGASLRLDVLGVPPACLMS